MPLVYQQNINGDTKLGVWHINEAEDFFLKQVPLQQEIAHPHKRLQHLAGRCLLTVLFPGFPTALIQVADTRKPFIENDPYHFSISHCGDFAAVIVSTGQRVGIDIEKITEKIGRVMHKFLGAEETALLPRDRLIESATLLWSAKEAIFKWYGAGQVDFKEHMPVRSFGKPGKLQIQFLKNDDRLLDVYFIAMQGHWLSWVMTKE